MRLKESNIEFVIEFIKNGQTTGFFISLKSDNKRDGRDYKTDSKDSLPVSAQKYLKKARKERIKADPKIIKDNVNNIQYIYKL